MKFILLGEPKSTNNIYKTLCRGNFPSRYMSAAGKKLKSEYTEQIKSQYKGKPLKTPIEAKIALWHGTKRKSDIDNFSKILFDSFTGIVYEDDSQIERLEITRGYDKENPRIEVELSTVNP
jgi:Holliday junction resolvase RusA-like endonuclease